MKKKGFTLIELLAVIVILAIIALIAVPIVINIINDAKEESQKRSIDNYARAVEQAVYRYTLNTGKTIFGKFTTTDGKKLIQDDITIDVDYKGNVVPGDIIVNKDGKIYLSDFKVDGKIIDYSYGEVTYNMLMERETTPDGNGFFVTADGFLSTGIDVKKISKFNILSTLNITDEYNKSDCSYSQDKSVMCYWKVDFIEGDNTYYEMNIAANGEVYTPKNSLGLFSKLGYEKLTELNFTGLNTKYTENMRSMFNKTGYTAMTTLNLGDKFDTSNVTNMQQMFQQTGYTAMTTLNLGSKFDTSNVTNMLQMFYQTGYTKMTTLNLGNKFDTSNVTNMTYMFYATGYNKMTTLNLGNKFNTSKVTNMYSMFEKTGYTAMASLDLGDKFDTSKVTDMKAMFNKTGYTAMTTLNLGSKFVIPTSASIDLMFGYCGKSGVLTKVIVPNEALKTKILGLGNNNVPSWWNTNNIIAINNNRS